MITLREAGRDAVGLDLRASPYTDAVGSIADRAFVREAMASVTAVVHTATLHKPHVATHSKQDFVDTNVTGTLNLLEEAVLHNVDRFLFTSTTSTFGGALTPAAGAPAAWITEDVAPIPKNVYGATKTAAEDLCQLFHRNDRLPVLVLRTSRFFPEDDDNATTRERYAGENAKTNELLYRRVDVHDVVTAHLRGLERAPAIGFRKFIISATTPFARADAEALPADAPAVVRRHFPDYERVYATLGWRMFPAIERDYDNTRARRELGWLPEFDFARALDRLSRGADPRSPLAQRIGAKGYHDRAFENGPYPVV